VPAEDATPADEARPGFGARSPLDPEARLLARERREKLAAAIDRLDGRQRTVFMLCHYGDCSPREVSAITGLNESTVRVHLFRAARKLRGLLGGKA
jgi:RNA polymerase sigma-70 factor (ECF subfamily)